MPKCPGIGPNRERKQRCDNTIAVRMFLLRLVRPPMPDAHKLAPADPSDLAAALGYALRYRGRKRPPQRGRRHAGDRCNALGGALRAVGLRGKTYLRANKTGP